MRATAYQLTDPHELAKVFNLALAGQTLDIQILFDGSAGLD
jgi:hypothetical protein